MAQVTTKGMDAAASGADRWIVESLGRGRGAFIGRITPSGSRSFYFRYADRDRRQVRLKIGDYDPSGRAGLSVADARKIALEWSSLYRGDEKRGISPIRDLRGYFEQQRRIAEEEDRARLAELERQRREAEDAARQAELERQRRLTVRQLFERWASVELARQIGPNGKPSGRKDGGLYVRQQFERHVFPAIGDVAVADLRKSDLMAIFDTHKARGALRTVGVLFSDLKQMLRFAVLREIIPTNPLEGLGRSDVGGTVGEERERVLSVEEIRLLAQALPQSRMNRRSELAVWLILSTVCRAGELLRARWDNVDMTARKWRIPAEDAKNGREHVVHMSDFALRHMRALAELRELGRDGQPTPWLFPDREGKGPVCIKSFGKQIADRQRSALQERLSRRTLATDALVLPGGHWTAHDLRRTGATLMADKLGVHPAIVDECLNHKVPSKVSRTYQVTRRWAEQARAFDALGEFLERVISGTEERVNVIPLARGAAA